MKNINLYIDFDDVIIKSSVMIEKRLNDVYKWASISYCINRINKLHLAYEERINLIRTREMYIKNNFSSDKAKELLYELFIYEMNFKKIYSYMLDIISENIKYRVFNLDYVLEVLNNCYKYYNCDKNCEEFYLDYDIILDVSNEIDDAFNFVKTVMKLDNINSKILSHENCERECMRKNDIVRENIGDIPIYLIPYHKDSFSLVNRPINSKAKYIMEIEKIDMLDENYILIDDSKTNVNSWCECGGKGILFSQNSVVGFKYQMHHMTLDSFYKCLNEEQLKLIKKR